jgi:non-heme chloroperoxidase
MLLDTSQPVRRASSGIVIVMNRYSLSVLGVLLAAATSASAQQLEWRDPSPHVVKFVTVESEVQLEVLDFGGSGRALVLLAGLGATAHVYDDFAPALTARYHVLAITRRAHGRSSTPLKGYGFSRLAEDVMRVIDALGVNRPTVIGHSFAGEELHVLGARYSEKIAGLVYLDAAFNRGDDSDSAAYDAVARGLATPPGPEPRDRASFAAWRLYLERTQGAAGPEAHLRARFLTNPDGSVGGQWAPDLPIRQEMTKEMRAAYNPYNPERIRVPALAVYAAPKSVDDLLRRGSSDRSRFPEDVIARTADDQALRKRIEKLYQLTRKRVEDHENWFKMFAPQGRVTEISAPHFLFVTNPVEVVQQIDAFFSALPEAR